MKKVVILLATLVASSVALAETAKSNDVLQTISGGKAENTVVASDTSTLNPEMAPGTAGSTAQPHAMTAEKPAKHHHKKHHHHHHHHHHHNAGAAAPSTPAPVAAPAEQSH